MGGERRVAALWLQNDIQNDSEVRGGTNRELSTLLNVFGEIPPTHMLVLMRLKGQLSLLL